MGPATRVGYCRVSTATGEQLAALENQRARLAAAGVTEILEDIESGLSQDRPSYLELLRRIDTRSAEEIVVTRLDRLGRDAAATDALIAIAAKRGVRIHCLDGGTVDAQTPQGFLLSRIATSMAEVESRMLSLRVRAGYAEARKRHRPSRHRAPWGYAKNADGSALEPHPIEFPRAQQFIEMLRSNNWRVQTTLNQWHREQLGPIPLNTIRSVRWWLMNPILRGGLGYKRNGHTFTEVVWDLHPPLLSHSDFTIMERSAQENRNRWGERATTPPKLLSGLVRCSACNRCLTYRNGKKTAALMCRQLQCQQRYKAIRESTIIDAINRALSGRAETLAAIPQRENPEREALVAQIAALEAQGDPDLAPAIALKRERLAALSPHDAPDPHLLEVFRDPSNWELLTREELRELYLGLVDQVIVTPPQVDFVRLRV